MKRHEADADRPRLVHKLADLARAVDAIVARVATLETRASEIDRRAEIAATGARAWRVWGEARGEVVIVADTGEVARVPRGLARTLAAGRELDLGFRDADDGQVELLDAHGRVAARLPRAAFLALPRLFGGDVRLPSGTRSQSHAVSPETRPASIGAEARNEADPRAVAPVRLQDTTSRPSLTRVSPACDLSETKETKATKERKR